jgi:thiol-disulfide isomerase/thioredoxin
MKLILSILIILSVLGYAQELPVSGKSYKITYTPSNETPLSKSESMDVVFAFDYWGTSYYYSHGSASLFLNVLEPDSGRTKIKTMIKENKIWSAEIEIPEDVTLLSYYFTNGDYFDYNDKKTYVSYIYDENKKPVRNARFRNVDFLVMAESSQFDQIAEIKKEINDYPDNLIAYVPYWRMKFDIAENINELTDLRDEFENQFVKLKEKIGETDSVLVTEASVYYHLPRLYLKFDDKSPEAKEAVDKMISIIARISAEKRGPYLTAVYSCTQRRIDSEKFSIEIIGKEAPVFEFTDVNGNSYKLSDFRGKYVLLDFWGIWCEPCRYEIPYIKKAYDNYKNQGFEFISISSDLLLGKAIEDDYKDFQTEKEMNWIQILDKKEKSIILKYNIVKFPTLFLIDKNGVVLSVDDGLAGVDLENTLSSYVKK